MNREFPDDTFLARWLSGQLTPAEQQLLEAREDVDLLRELAERARQLEPPAFSEEAAWKRLNARRKARPARRLRLRWVYSAAAVLILLVGFWFLLPTSEQQYTSPAGRQLTIFLPDDSQVVLNAESVLSFQKRLWPPRRMVRLEGEAFFSVREGPAFRVETPGGTVEVLGTSFNVRDRENDFSVACFSGKVQVKGGGREQLLTKGQAVSLIDDRWKLETFPLSPAPPWTRGISEFRGIPLNRVFVEMERQYGIRIDYPEDDTRQYTGFFVHNDLEEALRSVCVPMKLNYRIEGNNQVRIFKE